MAAMTARIVKAWHASTADDLAAGIAWYDVARADAARIAGLYGLSVEQAAGIIAALSPRNRWSVNVSQAERVAAAAAMGAECPAVSTGDNRKKAWACTRVIDPLDVLTGPKVRRFYQNIIGDQSAVTVDVWAARLAEGENNENAPRGRRYDLIESAYVTAAAIIGDVSPRDVQAATWIHIRGAAH